MLRFDKTKVAKKNIMLPKKKEIWNVNIDNIVISNLIETKANPKYLIGYFDKVIRPLVLILPKMSGYVRYLKLKIKIIN